jgi:low affinity Fe/Cu permease
MDGGFGFDPGIWAVLPDTQNGTTRTNVKNRKRPRRFSEIKRTGAFHKLARGAARATGHPAAFGIAVSAIVVWAALGPIFHFSDTWQLVINTATTIVTFLMVFLLQNTQNRDSQAMQLKLDELLRATQTAHNALLDIEELSDEELDQIKRSFEQLARKARTDLRAGRADLGCPEPKKPNGAQHPTASPKS